MAKILVVDDSDDVRTLVGRFLTAKGFEVLFAVDGADAIRQTRDGAPDIVLMDLNMPGIDGFEATRQLKADPVARQIPVLALSAEDQISNRDAIYAAGCDGFIAKPIDFPNLVGKLEKHLQR